MQNQIKLAKETAKEGMYLAHGDVGMYDIGKTKELATVRGRHWVRFSLPMEVNLISDKLLKVYRAGCHGLGYVIFHDVAMLEDERDLILSITKTKQGA